MKNELDIAFDDWCAAHRKQMLEAGETVAAMAERNRMDFEAGYKAQEHVVSRFKHERQLFAQMLQYPENWDIKKYPTLTSAMRHVMQSYIDMVRLAHVNQPYREK